MPETMQANPPNRGIIAIINSNITAIFPTDVTAVDASNSVVQLEKNNAKRNAI